MKPRKGTMQNNRRSFFPTHLIIFLCSIFLFPTQAQNAEKMPYSHKKAKLIRLDTLPYSPKLIQKITKGIIISSSDVKTLKEKKEQKQKLKFSVTGLHKKSCRFALRKLSQYEIYKNHIGFIKESRYLESKGRVDFLLSSLLLPFDMRLNFKIPRIKSPGTYHFLFDQGFLKNLKGIIHVADSKNQCLFHTTASWIGPHSGINNTVFAFFSKALSELAMKNLFRMSKTF
ncbi:MAG: hypothetical protein VXY34_06710 [Bdellovibrionota bacterium]|nr:hypothetical protein [Bdellovibrionota bacterium]|tara:strand:- start:748 stop:1434 length:687 start_codon:yes stop_codon:yes gene_type:complete